MIKLMQTYCFSLKLHPIVLARISGSDLQQFLLWYYNGDSLFPSSLNICNLEFLWKENMSLIPHFFAYSIIYLYQD